MLVDRQTDRHLSALVSRVCESASVHARGAERDARTWEHKQSNGGREGSREQEMMIAEGEVWAVKLYKIHGGKKGMKGS